MSHLLANEIIIKNKNERFFFWDRGGGAISSCYFVGLEKGWGLYP